MKEFPKINDSVDCPPDRGNAGYRGVVTGVGYNVHTNSLGIKYVWCDVKGPEHTSVWPSHRLGYHIQ